MHFENTILNSKKWLNDFVKVIMSFFPVIIVFYYHYWKYVIKLNINNNNNNDVVVVEIHGEKFIKLKKKKKSTREIY